MSRVVVIGGGLAGIRAALDCARSGVQVTLLESRGRLGGAAYSFVRDGLRVDNGQHVFLRCCVEYQALVQEIGAQQLVALQERLAIPVLTPGAPTAWLRRSGLPAPLHLARTLLRYPLLGLGERVSVARTMRALREVDADDRAADEQSFGEWLTQHGQGVDALQCVWELVARPTLNLRAADASLAQAAYVFQQGLLSDTGAADIGYAKCSLGEIHDTAARHALEQAGVEVRLRAGAVALRTCSDGFHVEVSCEPTLVADAVVLAVPPHRAARLLPDAAGVETHALESLGSSPVVDLHVVFDRRVLELPFAAGARSPVQWVFDRTSAAGLSDGQYLAISLSAADQELRESSDELRARFLPALAELLPAARDAKVRSFFVTREHAATFRAAPGARALRPSARTRVPGLVLAGAWTDTGWPATMEGAVRSGRIAAAEVLSGLAQSATVGLAVAA